MVLRFRRDLQSLDKNNNSRFIVYSNAPRPLSQSASSRFGQSVPHRGTVSRRGTFIDTILFICAPLYALLCAPKIPRRRRSAKAHALRFIDFVYMWTNKKYRSVNYYCRGSSRQPTIKILYPASVSFVRGDSAFFLPRRSTAFILR